MTAGAVKEKDTIPAWISEGLPERLDRDLLARAYRFSESAHEGQKRLSGDKYVSHCVEVAKILVDLQLDSTTVASALIHDVVEDTAVTVDEVEAEFGKEIAERAAAIILVHNHPSGDPTPSPDDRVVTEQLVQAGKVLDIPVQDHVIIGRGRYISFAEAGLL